MKQPQGVSLPVRKMGIKDIEFSGFPSAIASLAENDSIELFEKKIYRTVVNKKSVYFRLETIRKAGEASFLYLSKTLADHLGISEKPEKEFTLEFHEAAPEHLEEVTAETELPHPNCDQLFLTAFHFLSTRNIPINDGFTFEFPMGGLLFPFHVSVPAPGILTENTKLDLKGPREKSNPVGDKKRNEKQIDETAENELQKLINEKEEIEKEVNALRSAVSALSIEKKKIDSENSALSAKINNITSHIESLDKRINKGKQDV